jgi:purine-nucleoside phosphorylase
VSADAIAFSEFIEEARRTRPVAAFVFGSGMSALAKRARTVCSIPFATIPGLAVSSVSGHDGNLHLADWVNCRVLIFAGRLHYYEGHAWERVVQPVRLADDCKVRILVLTNAAGGIHPDLDPGTLMSIRDHFPWTYPGCWRQHLTSDRVTPSPYSGRLLSALQDAAASSGIHLHAGIYAAVLGPCYETPAEIRALRTLGADAVGMSTAREICTGQELGLECAAVSCITNCAAGLSASPIQHEEVLINAAAQTEHLGRLLEAFLQRV